MSTEPTASVGSQAPRLPIDAHRAEIAALVRDHPVVIVCGETGSGKSTQLPRICLEAGRGEQGTIALTQPRRLAARSIAARIAAETGTALGSLVGYQVRFDRRASARTRLRVVTDGVLLSELAVDPLLRRYDTILVDEAHERSINIDLLLGALVGLLRRRPELRVVITSATIDPERFAAHFGGAPIVEVSGRGFPIEIEWREPAGASGDADPSSPDAVVPAVRECLERLPEGDLLVFLPGEREIGDCAEALRSVPSMRGVEILPLMARLGDEAQDRIFAAHRARRVVLATNVAETSLTVPGIRAVVDSGLARLRRYSGRSRVERLLVEPISRASAAQRAGRCGRVGPGLCVRLYSEASWAERPERTTPEILRSDLAGVVLRMKAAGLGDPSSFPFLDAPAPRLWQDGLDTLVELGAIDRRGGLTAVGRAMSELPVDPRIARMIVAAQRSECLEPVLAIAAALSVQDPIETPAPTASAAPSPAAAPSESNGGPPPVLADAAVRRERHPDSDFIALWHLWQEVQEARRTRGSSAMNRWCREQGLSPRRVREWQEVHDQLERLSGRGRPDERAAAPGPSTDATIHRALLAGLASRVGRRQDDGTYANPSGGAFSIHRSSALARKSPTWIMAAEIMDTGRRTARLAARIQGDWIERVAPHLVRRQHSEPHWIAESGHVAAWEKVLFGSLVVVPRRRVPYEPIDPEGARNVFIHAALVDEGLRSSAEFLEHNRTLRERIERAEHKRRESGLLVDVEARYAFYDARLPPSVVNAPSFEAWRRDAERRDPRILFMREQDLLARPVDVSAFPDEIGTAAGPVPLRYDHAPGTIQDGVTMRVPLSALGAVDAEKAEWLVPGLRAAKVEALLRSLPKRLRTRFVPARDFAQGAVEHFARQACDGSLRAALARYLTSLAGTAVEPSDFDLRALPEELHMRFEVIGDDGAVLDSGRDLGALQATWAGRAADEFRARALRAAPGAEVHGRSAWDFDAIPERIDLGHGAWAHPAVVDEGEGVGVGVRLMPSADEAEEAMRQGLRRLALVELAAPIQHHLSFHAAWPRIEERWPLLAADASSDRSGGSESPSRRALRRASELAVEHAALQAPLPRSAEAFEARLLQAAPRLHERCAEVVALVDRLLEATASIRAELAAGTPAAWSEAVESIATHLDATARESLFDRSMSEVALASSSIEADRARLRRLPHGGAERDRQAAARVAPWALRAAAALQAHPAGSPRHGAARSFAREAERLRVAVHGGRPGFPAPIATIESELERLWSALA